MPQEDEAFGFLLAEFFDVVATLAILRLILQSAGRLEQDSESYPLADCAEKLGSNSEKYI